MESISELFSQYLPTRTLGFPKRNSRQDKWGKCCQRGARGCPGHWVTFSVTPSIISHHLYFQSLITNFDLLFWIIIVLKRSIDLRWLFVVFPVLLFILRWSCFQSFTMSFVIYIFNNFPSFLFSIIFNEWNSESYFFLIYIFS